MASLVGKWAYDSAENLEEYMVASGLYVRSTAKVIYGRGKLRKKEKPGVPDNLREMARNSKPSMDVSQSGDSWSIKTVVGDKTKETTFKVGEEFDSVSLTGQPLKCKVSVEGNVMSEVQKAGDAEVLITREATGDKLISGFTSDQQLRSFTDEKS